jgi:hypothetical protein
MPKTSPHPAVVIAMLIYGAALTLPGAEPVAKAAMVLTFTVGLYYRR